MNDNQGGRSRRLKLLTSITAGLSLLAGALLFAEHDAGARTLPLSAAQLSGNQSTAATGLAASDPTIIQNVTVPSTATTGTTQTGSLSQVVVIDDITVVQSIIFQVSNSRTSLNCATLLQDFAIISRVLGSPTVVQTFGVTTLQNTLSILQRLSLGCPIPSGAAAL